MKTRSALLLLLLSFGLVIPIRAATPDAKLIDVNKIWDAAPHNAFTDLVRFQNKWFCVFREGRAHVSPDGALRLLTSTNGSQWESAALITSTQGDLRDAKITVTPDNRLMLSGAVALPQPPEIKHQSLAWFSKDGTDWEWKDLGMRIGGPHMLALPDGRIVAAGRLYKGEVRTSLMWLDPEEGELTEILKLPSGGDCSYPGLVCPRGGCDSRFDYPPVVSTNTYQAFVHYSANPKVIGCPGLPKPFKLGGFALSGYGYVLGFNYLGNHPTLSESAALNWTSPHSLNDINSLPLLTELNVWTPTGLQTVAPHEPNGAVDEEGDADEPKRRRPIFQGHRGGRRQCRISRRLGNVEAGRQNGGIPTDADRQRTLWHVVRVVHRTSTTQPGRKCHSRWTRIANGTVLPAR